jgi:hypothetical protein
MMMGYGQEAFSADDKPPVTGGLPGRKNESGLLYRRAFSRIGEGARSNDGS